jgi:hypothetical protein
MPINKLTLDLDLWRCGAAYDEPANGLGEGATMLYDPILPNHNQCCLGQFSLQCDFSTREVNHVSGPAALAADTRLRARHSHPDQYPKREEYLKLFTLTEYGRHFCTDLASRLININDDSDTTLQTKVDGIRTHLAAHGITLEVINGEKYNVK